VIPQIARPPSTDITQIEQFLGLRENVSFCFSFGTAAIQADLKCYQSFSGMAHVYLNSALKQSLLSLCGYIHLVACMDWVCFPWMDTHLKLLCTAFSGCNPKP
jgi:hypothetical protein